MAVGLIGREALRYVTKEKLTGLGLCVHTRALAHLGRGLREIEVLAFSSRYKMLPCVVVSSED